MRGSGGSFAEGFINAFLAARRMRMEQQRFDMQNRYYQMLMNQKAQLPNAMNRGANSATESAAREGYGPDGGGAKPGPNNTPNNIDPSIPPEGRALLSTIGGPESQGAYNVRYSPRGGATFTDMAQHPMIAERTPDGKSTSDAAGRYQFLSSTFHQIAQVLHLPDFSPASQDKAAWYLAQQTYAKANNGADLLTALKSGNPQTLAGVAGSLKSQWPSLPGGTEQGTSLPSFVKNFQTSLKSVGTGDPMPLQGAAPADGSAPASDTPIPSPNNQGAKQSANPAAYTAADSGGPKHYDAARGEVVWDSTNQPVSGGGSANDPLTAKPGPDTSDWNEDSARAAAQKAAQNPTANNPDNSTPATPTTTPIPGPVSQNYGSQDDNLASAQQASLPPQDDMMNYQVAQNDTPMYDNEDEFRRGGLVRAYADGGVVGDDDDDITQAAPPADDSTADDTPIDPTQVADTDGGALPVQDAAYGPNYGMSRMASQARRAGMTRMPSATGGSNMGVPRGMGGGRGFPGGVGNMPGGMGYTPSGFGLDSLAPQITDGQGGLSDMAVQAIQGGVSALKEMLGGGGVLASNPRQDEMRRTLRNGGGGATEEDVKDISQTFDPNETLDTSFRNIGALEAGYRYYSATGNPQAANQMAASILQYTHSTFMKFGAEAYNRFHRGDRDGTAKMMEHAYNAVPDAQEASIKPMPDGSMMVTTMDANGKPVHEMRASEQQILGAVVGAKNGSLYWQLLNDAVAPRLTAAQRPMSPEFQKWSQTMDAGGATPPAQGGGQTPPPAGNTPAPAQASATGPATGDSNTGVIPSPSATPIATPSVTPAPTTPAAPAGATPPVPTSPPGGQATEAPAPVAAQPPGAGVVPSPTDTPPSDTATVTPASVQGSATSAPNQGVIPTAAEAQMHAIPMAAFVNEVYRHAPSMPPQLASAPPVFPDARETTAARLRVQQARNNWINTTYKPFQAEAQRIITAEQTYRTQMAIANRQGQTQAHSDAAADTRAYVTSKLAANNQKAADARQAQRDADNAARDVTKENDKIQTPMGVKDLAEMGSAFVGPNTDPFGFAQQQLTQEIGKMGEPIDQRFSPDEKDALSQFTVQFMAGSHGSLNANAAARLVAKLVTPNDINPGQQQNAEPFNTAYNANLKMFRLSTPQGATVDIPQNTMDNIISIRSGQKQRDTGIAKRNYAQTDADTRAYGEQGAKLEGVIRHADMTPPPIPSLPVIDRAMSLPLPPGRMVRPVTINTPDDSGNAGAWGANYDTGALSPPRKRR